MRRAVMFAAVAMLAGCAAGRPVVREEPPVPDDTADRARAVIAPFKAELMGALTTALRDGGPENALEVCRLQAPAIAARAAGEDVAIGRTSHRLRNPANAPEEWMKPLLEAYVANPADTTSRVVRVDARHVGYVEPIHVKSPCLTCHGTNLTEPVRESLRTLYPDDRATGFAKDDFRGMFWVRLAG